MLSTKEITKMYKGTKITSRVDLYKTKQSGSKSSQTGSAGGAVLRNFLTCEIYRFVNFCNTANFTYSSFSSAFLLQISSEMIMHLRVRLGFVVFKSTRRK